MATISFFPREKTPNLRKDKSEAEKNFIGGKNNKKAKKQKVLDKPRKEMTRDEEEEAEGEEEEEEEEGEEEEELKSREEE